MTNINPTATFSGHSNRGLQVGSNSGQVHITNIHGQSQGSSTKLNPSSTVPFRRDPDFVDRGILAEISKKCLEPASRVALVGLGGVGKSQLAIEYSYRIRQDFPQTWVFWVHASNAARFEEGYKMIADRVKLFRGNEPTADILQLVNNWLGDEANGRWIMILDNADDLTVLSDLRRGLKPDIDGSEGRALSLSNFLPQTPNGSILVTSRSQDAALKLTGSYHDIIKVEPMDESRALLLFEKKLQGDFDQGDARELLRVLDYMPLAISQAAAYICQRAPRTTVANYLDEFRKSDSNQANLLNRNAEDLRRDSEASNSIITTWQISFEYIRVKRPSAARLLSLMSFFDRQGIPESLLHRYDHSEVEFEDDVFTLTNYSLITTNGKDGLFEMHRLVQFSTRKWLELNSELEKWKKIYIKIIWEAFPFGKYENWKICQTIFPHAEALLAYRPTEKKYLLYWSEILCNAGWYARTQGNFLTAEKMNQQALEEREKALGKEHPDTLTSLHNLAVVLSDQGKYEAAEEMSRRALDGYEKALGKEHPNTLTSVSNLALVLADQGKYKAAEEMNRRALDGTEKALGKEHPDTLASVHNLAGVLGHQGKYEAAEEMNRRALDGREKALGKEHPNTLTSVSNLALVLSKQGKYEAAEEMNRRALDGSEKTLGKEHPDTLTSVSNLALVLSKQGKYEAAEEMSRRALEGREKALGKEHPSTLSSVYGLAYLFHQKKQYKDATTLYERSCAGFQKVLGANHPDTLGCSANYSAMIEETKAPHPPILTNIQNERNEERPRPRPREERTKETKSAPPFLPTNIQNERNEERPRPGPREERTKEMKNDTPLPTNIQNEGNEERPRPRRRKKRTKETKEHRSCCGFPGF